MSTTYLEAIERFHRLLDRARQLPLHEPAAMTLATADAAGRPSARIVLLRGVDERGFVFFTNSESDKGRQLRENSRAALCLYWDGLGEQVRVEGTVEPVADEESDAYWSTRPRESQLGGWASLQSQPLASLTELTDRLDEVERRFAGGPVPRPDHWHGYRVVPDRLEFWSNRSARLHHRLLYELCDGGEWRTSLLFP